MGRPALECGVDFLEGLNDEQWEGRRGSAGWISWNDCDATCEGQVSIESSGDTAAPTGKASVSDERSPPKDSSNGNRGAGDAERSRSESRKPPRTGKEHVPSVGGESEGIREPEGIREYTQTPQAPTLNTGPEDCSSS